MSVPDQKRTSTFAIAMILAIRQYFVTDREANVCCPQNTCIVVLETLVKCREFIVLIAPRYATHGARIVALANPPSGAATK